MIVGEGNTMTLSEYFENSRGFGVSATTDAAAQVDQAIYAKPLSWTRTTMGLALTLSKHAPLQGNE